MQIEVQREPTPYQLAQKIPPTKIAVSRKFGARQRHSKRYFYKNNWHEDQEADNVSLNRYTYHNSLWQCQLTDKPLLWKSIALPLRILQNLHFQSHATTIHED